MIGELSFFFFQAEDGIRDKLVTGVQTCALPIYRIAVASGRIAMSPAAFRLVAAGKAKKGDALGVARVAAIQAAKRTAELRSEERRVGKEGRSRWAPDH